MIFILDSYYKIKLKYINNKSYLTLDSEITYTQTLL